jgi:hypothetical protein
MVSFVLCISSPFGSLVLSDIWHVRFLSLYYPSLACLNKCQSAKVNKQHNNTNPASIPRLTRVLTFDFWIIQPSH